MATTTKRTKETVGTGDTTVADGQAETLSSARHRDDRNVVSLSGHLATAPDVRSFASGAHLARLLVTVRTQTDRPRTDVIPVTVWSPDEHVSSAERGARVIIDATVQRRFWTDDGERRSRVEVVATSVEVVEEPSAG